MPYRTAQDFFFLKWASRKKKNHGRSMGALPIIFFEKMGVKKKTMGALWAPCPLFFFEKMGSQKKKSWAAPIFWQFNFWAPRPLISPSPSSNKIFFCFRCVMHHLLSQNEYCKTLGIQGSWTPKNRTTKKWALPMIFF